jgi:uncharacterized Zn finger protein
MWSQRFLTRLESLVTPAAQSDQVYGLAITSGSVTAQVQGSRRKPYDVWIDLPVFTPAEWARAERAMAADPSCSAQLVDGEVPDDVEKLFARTGLSLLPAKAGDMTMDCSCPDWMVPCKHVTAVLQSLAAAFDADPFDLLVWRGRSRTRLVEHLSELAVPASPPVPAKPGPDVPLADCLDAYWLSSGDQQSELPGQPADRALDRLGRPDIMIRGRNLADLLRPVYEAMNSW